MFQRQKDLHQWLLRSRADLEGSPNPSAKKYVVYLKYFKDYLYLYINFKPSEYKIRD